MLSAEQREKRERELLGTVRGDFELVRPAGLLPVSGRPGKRGAFWVARCVKCGAEKLVRQTDYLCGDITKCHACFVRKKPKKEDSLHAVWRSMVSRCTLPSHKAWKNYGGRGITCCDRWLKFENFKKDVESLYRKGLDMDRIDNEKGYYPGNIRFVPRVVNCNNKRKSFRLLFGDEWLTTSEYVKRSGVKRSTVYWREKHGYIRSKKLGTS